ncbi:Membrane protein involved in the export of O-antigen and teichoic acid [Eubacterium maltosivorans]|nr:hypothetical protein EUMA32_11510 [Eubacterium maltosivorans]SDP03238.1 Membrane protein involved in the export of O-antigen and teichoic acid [Eubacterium maltosivorans]
MAQVINFVGSIIVARQYTEITIGYFTYIISIVSMFSTVVNGRYDVPIVSADTEEESFSLIKLSSLISIIVSILVTIGTFLFAIIGKSDYIEKLGELSFVFPLLLIAGIINILNAYNNRHAEYKLISTSYFIRTAFQNLIFLVAGIVNASTFGLLLGQLTGQFLGIKKQSKKLLEEIKRVFCISKKQMYEVAKKYRDQFTFSVPATFINAISYSVISLFIGDYFGMAILGLYSYSVRVLGIPLTIFSSNISKVHFKEANEEIKKGGLFINSTLKMILFSFVPAAGMMIFLMVFAPVLFELIYGGTWRMAGEYVRILSPMFGFRMTVGAVGFSFILANKQKVELLFQIFLLAAFGTLVMLSYVLNFEIVVFLTLLSIAYSVIYICELFAMLYYAKNNQNYKNGKIGDK